MNKETPKDGLATTHYENGQKKSEINFKDGVIFGKYTSWYENGQKREERNSIDGSLSERYSYEVDYILDWKYDNYRLDSYTNGRAIYWHENGQQKQEANFKDGIKDGRITYWYENSQIKADGNYNNGELIGNYKTWHENGHIHSDQNMLHGGEQLSELVTFISSDGEQTGSDGKSTSWHENGQKSSELNHKDGDRIGKQTHWFKSGKKITESFYTYEDYYHTSKLNGMKTWWYQNGQTKSEENFKHGMKNGKSTWWYESGQIKSENFYEIGKGFNGNEASLLNGKCTEWYENGQKKSEFNYKEGIFEGKYKTWYGNGNKKEERNYKVRLVKNTKSSRKEGKFTLWNEDGSKKSEIQYKDDGRHGKSIKWHNDGTKSEEKYKNGRFVSNLSIKEILNQNTDIRFKDIDSGYWRRVQPVWFIYDHHIGSIDNKIVNHQFSLEEEEQILSLINLQELFRLIFSPNDNEGNVVSAEIKYEYLNKSLMPQSWHMPISYEELLDQWRYDDTNFDDGIITYSKTLFDQRITENKCRQFLDRFALLNITSRDYDQRAISSDEKYKIINTWLYTLAEDIVEQWALKNNLEYHDYNSSNQYAPQDCRIAGVDVDVKTTTGIGRQHLKNFYRYKSEEDKAKNINEIIIGISSRTGKGWDPYLSDTSSSHVILGIYDPSIYSQINLELKYFKPSNNLVNVCYFQSLEGYFKTKTELDNYKKRKYDPKLIDYLTKTSLEGYEGSLIDKEEYIIDDGQYQDFSQMIYDGYRSFLPPIIYILLDYPVRLGAYIKSLLPKENHDLIPIIVELASKKKLQLFPHYFADYLLDKILSKEKIDEKAILPVIFSLIIVCDYQKVHALIYIKNLFKLAKILPNVRCKWHPNETMKDMSLSIFHSSYLPTVMAKCSHHPKHNTTIFTYSWKTGETLFYGQEDTKNCDLDDCGCLIHQPYDNKWYGRKNCKKYGQDLSYKDA